MFKFFKNLFTIFVPSYKEMLDLGYKASIKSGDFILKKKINDIEIAIHQSVEPFNQKFEGLIDFEIYEACFIISGNITIKATLEKVFDSVYPRGDFFFCFNRNLKFEMDEIVPLAKKLEAQIN